MKISDIIEASGFKVICEGDTQKSADKVFCCDLLSIAMSRAPAGCAWVTVMGNVNTVAVCVLADVPLLIMAEGMTLDEPSLARAKSEGITVLASELPVFDAAKLTDGLISAR